MSAWRSIAYYWLIGWSQLRIIGHIATTPWVALTSPSCDDAVDDGPSVHTSEYRPLLSLLLATLASSTSPQKPPATYTQVSDFGPHTNSIFLGGGDLYARATYTRVFTVASPQVLFSFWPSVSITGVTLHTKEQTVQQIMIDVLFSCCCRDC